MREQHVFGRDRCVSLELEYPMTVGALGRPQSRGCGLDACVERAFVTGQIDRVGHRSHEARAAARSPERMALSMVGGKEVAVQSPARKTLVHAVCGPGRSASCAGSVAMVARRSRTTCHGGSASGKPVSAATSLHTCRASASRGICISASAALMVTESRPG